MDINNLTNKIIICPNSLSKYFLTLRRENPLLNFSIYSLKELQYSKFGKVKDGATKVCKATLNYSLKDLVTYFSLIESGINPNIDSNIQEVVEVLLKNSLIERDELVDYKFKDKEVLVFGYCEDNIELKHLLKSLNVTKVTYFHTQHLYDLFNVDEKKDKKQLFKFKTIDEEVRYLFNFLIAGNNLNERKIKIVCNTSDYASYLKTYAKEYGLKLSFEDNESFANTNLGKELLTVVKNKENILDYIDSLISKDNIYKDTLVSIRNLINENLVILLDDSGKVSNDIYEDFVYLLNKVSVEKKHYENEIKVSSKLGFDPNYEYYVLGASDSFLPAIVQNNKIYDDAKLLENNINTSIIKNIENGVLTEFFIRCKFVKYISFHFQEGKEKVYQATCLDKAIEPEVLNFDYSKSVTKAYLSKAHDIQNKYGKTVHDLNFDSVVDLDDKFDSSFKKDNFSRDDKKNIKVSYTSLTQLFECPFKYYISHILRIDNYESTFAGKLGTFVHMVFEKIDSYDFEDAYLNALTYFKMSNELSKKEMMFIEADKKRFKVAYDLIKTNLFNSYKIKDFHHEETLKARFPEKKMTLEGKIDCYSTVGLDDEIVILDYKSGAFSVGNLEKYSQGLDLQLLIYCYLISNNPETKESKIAGAYFCPVLSTQLNENAADYIDGYKIKGLSFTTLLETSGLAKGNKLKLNTDVEVQYKDIIEERLDAANEIIRSFTFSITPYDRVKACEYCQFRSMCFKYFASECLNLDVADDEGGEDDGTK